MTFTRRAVALAASLLAFGCSPGGTEQASAGAQATGATASATPGDPQAFELLVEGGRIRTPTPGRPTGGYMDLVNDGVSALRLTGATSPDFGRIELHDHVEKDGMMSMMKVEGVDVPPSRTVTFAPGGLHMMLFDPTRVIQRGEVLKITLQFGGAGEATASFLVVDEVPTAKERARMATEIPPLEGQTGPVGATIASPAPAAPVAPAEPSVQAPAQAPAPDAAMANHAGHAN
jgi:copper(I)-binding protein